MNKCRTFLRLGSILVICGMATGLLCLPSSEVVSASVAEGVGPSGGPNQEAPSGGPNQEAIDHISEAKIAIQNGDTEGAQRHLDLAHQALGMCTGCYCPDC
jgi:hypothetical protein